MYEKTFLREYGDLVKQQHCHLQYEIIDYGNTKDENCNLE